VLLRSGRIFLIAQDVSVSLLQGSVREWSRRIPKPRSCCSLSRLSGRGVAGCQQRTNGLYMPHMSAR